MGFRHLCEWTEREKAKFDVSWFDLRTNLFTRYKHRETAVELKWCPIGDEDDLATQKLRTTRHHLSSISIAVYRRDHAVLGWLI